MYTVQFNYHVLKQHYIVTLVSLGIQWKLTFHREGVEVI